jgi:hypothetical protein
VLLGMYWCNVLRLMGSDVCVIDVFKGLREGLMGWLESSFYVIFDRGVIAVGVGGVSSSVRWYY